MAGLIFSGDSDKLTQGRGFAILAACFGTRSERLMQPGGEEIGPGNHVLIEANELCSWPTSKGCLSLMLVRTDHEWVQAGNTGEDATGE